jgi:hypothetical protein
MKLGATQALGKTCPTAPYPANITLRLNPDFCSNSYGTDLLKTICAALFSQAKPDYEFDCRTERDAQGHIVAVHGYSAHILHMLMELVHFK